MIWRKFHEIFGTNLKIALEKTFTFKIKKGGKVDLDPLYWEYNLVYIDNRRSEKPRTRIYEPADQILKDNDQEAVHIFFKPTSPTDFWFERLVFYHPRNKQKQWLVAARHNEIYPFGFDSWNSQNKTYLPLAYPGLSNQFKPVYFKIQAPDTDNRGENFIYLEVWAWDKNKKTIVQARQVTSEEAPRILESAAPSESGKIVYSV